MKELTINTPILLSNGSVASIKQKLGDGGQGTVYRVSVDGKDYALKVYNKFPAKQFVHNLEENVKKGAPTPHFLWPLWTINSSKMFGYVMNIRPKDYVDFSKFLIAKARFASWSAMINAAIQITYAFRELHRKGLSYQDLNDGNFFFNPATGDVLICDNDNVCPPSTNLGIKGKCRYMAPEVVIGNNNPNNLSDYFSLSVVLFMLFFNNHPFDGKRVADVPCLNDAIERNVYGENPIFIYDPNKSNNRPVRGIHTNVINRWPLFPDFFRQAFMDAFDEESLKNPDKRKSDNDWIRILSQLRSQTIMHTCGNEAFVDIDKTFTLCFNCQKSIEKPLILTIGRHRIALYPKMKVYANQTSLSDDMFAIIGEVIVNKKNPNVWGLMNRTNDTWRATYPNGKELEIQPNTGLPIYKDVEILFSTHVKGNIQ